MKNDKNVVDLIDNLHKTMKKLSIILVFLYKLIDYQVIALEE